MTSKASFPGSVRRSRGKLFLTVFICALLTCCFGGGAMAQLWQAQGPSPINQGQAQIDPDSPVDGAIQSLLVDPTDSNTLYVGAVNGGIWKTTNGGGAWTPLTDGQNSLSMGGMALDPGTPSRILAGFGVFSNWRGTGGPREGVIFSSDAGATWTSVGGAITTNTNVSSVLVKDQLMFVASRDKILEDSTPTPVTGLFRSTDGGTSFIQISGSGGLPTGSVTSLAFDPSNYNCVYAASQKQGIFRSDDQGKTWTNITPANTGIGTTTQNVQLTVGAGGQSLFMGVTNNLGSGNVQLQSVWRSLDRGATWQNMGGQGSGAGQGLPGTIETGQFAGIQPGGQGDINFALLADRNNPNYVYISGDVQAARNALTNTLPNQIGANGWYGQIMRGDASKGLSSPPEVDNWTPATPYTGQWLPLTSNFAANSTDPHADSRSLAFDANGNLLETNDGGVYRRSDPQSSTGQWTSLNGNLQITEILGMSYDSNTHTVISGNQDNGAAEQNKVDGNPSLTWREMVLGDGAKTAVNDGDHTFSVHYLSYWNLSNFTRIKVNTDNKILAEVDDTDLKVVTGPGTTESLKKYEKDVGSSIPTLAPIRVDQAAKTNLAIGTQRIYLGTDDASSGLTQDLTLTDITTSTFASSVADIAYGRPGNANLLLAAEGNRLWLSTTLLVGSLTQLTNYNGTNSITSVCINAISNDKFYAADGSAVRSTEDTGASWTKRLSLSQLNALQFITYGGVNAVVAGGYGTVYAARDTDLNNWFNLNLTAKLPNTIINQMDYSSRDDTLAVGMQGRGAFTLANASTLMPATTPSSVDSNWIRLLGASSDNQTLNGGTVQTPNPITYAKDLTLTTLGGTFDTAGSDVTVSGVIKGDGSFTKAGAGTLSLQGTNTYAGGTLFNAGTVNILSDANLGLASGGLSFNGGTLQAGNNFSSSRAVTLNPYGGIFDTGTYTSTLSGSMSGPGTFQVQGSGNLLLQGTNTYAGGTILNGGVGSTLTLKVVNDANLGAATGPLTFNGGTLQAGAALTTSRTMVVLDNGGTFDTGTFASTFNGPLFGYGTFTQQGTGSLTLGGDGSPFAGTYTLNSGTFTLNNALGSTLSPANMVVTAGTTLSGSGALVGSLNLVGDGSGFTGSVVVPSTSTMSGTGAFGGTLNLQGSGSGYGGTYTVTNSTFNLANTLGSTGSPATVVINPSGTMTGSGTLVGTVINKGLISPGNSPGILTFTGSYTQTASGTYRAEIASTSSYDQIVVTPALPLTGTASLAGTITPILLGGYRPLAHTVFSGLVTATGGITGTFNPLTNPFFAPTLFWQPRYSANSFDLVVQRDYTNPGLGLNSNQLAVGTMLNGLASATSGDLNTVMNAIDSLPASTNVQDAFKQISPEKAGALTSLGFAGATFQMRNLATRTTNLRFAPEGSGVVSSLNPGGLSFNYSKLEGVMLAYNGASLSNLFSARKEFNASESRWGLFADGGAAFGSQKTSVNQTGYNFTLGGLTAGADYRLLDNLLLGLATGYSHTSSGFYGSGGSVNANTVPFNAYAVYFPGSLYAYGSLGYALNLFDLERGINFGGLARTARSSTTGHQFNLYGETGYDLKLRPFILTPSATLAYSALWVGGFTEQDAGALNLKVAAQNANSVQTGLGGRLTVPLQVGSVQVAPQGYAFFQHEFANGSRGLNASLSQGSSTFNFQTDAAKRNFAVVGANVTVGLTKNLYAQVNYNAEVGRGNYSAQSVNAGLRLEF